MAVADTVEVVLEADTSRYLTELRTADAAFARITSNMEREATEAGAAFSRLGTQASGALNNAANQAPRAANAIRNVGGQVGNLGAQFQDIAVQLQSGTSPLTIALQQGTQIGEAMRQAGGGVKALGAAFLTLLNPVTIATIAIIALAGAAIQYLSTLVPKTETANEALARHRKALEDIVEGYEGAEKALGDYANAVNTLPRNVAIAQINAQFAEMRKEVDQFTVKAREAGQVVNSFGTSAERAVRGAATQFANGEISAEEFYIELQRIRTTDMGPLEFALGGLITTMQDGALKAIALGNAINQVVAASHALAGIAQDQTLADFFDENAVEKVIDTLKGLTPELRTQQQIIEDTYSKALTNPALTEQAREQLSIAKDTAIAANAEVEARQKAEEAARKQVAAGKQSVDAAEREREAVVKLIEALQFEQSLIGLTNEQKAVANALRTAGAAATEEERLQIQGIIESNYALNEALARQKEAYDDIKELANTVLSGFINDIREGKSAGEAFSNVLDNIIDKLIEIALQTTLNAIFPGLGTVSGLFGGGKASGGSVNRGTTYMVGEKGPELFTPTSAGNITPNHKLGGAGATKIVLDVQEGAAFSTRVREVAGPQSVEITRGGLTTYDRALPGRSAEKDARYGG
jgi:hypothetical protein